MDHHKSCYPVDTRLTPIYSPTAWVGYNWALILYCCLILAKYIFFSVVDYRHGALQKKHIERPIPPLFQKAYDLEVEQIEKVRKRIQEKKNK